MNADYKIDKFVTKYFGNKSIDEQDKIFKELKNLVREAKKETLSSLKEHIDGVINWI